MEKNQDISQVIIVEGKTDTQKLKKIFGKKIETIETNGLSLNQQTINLIQKINDRNGVIIFTDPDGPGKKIREILIKKLNGKVLNAFITKNDIDKTSKKIGIAEADEQAIKNALKNLIKFDQKQETISWKEYLDNDFYLKKNRRLICQEYGFDENMNSKTLFKWINWIGLTKKELHKILKRQEKSYE